MQNCPLETTQIACVMALNVRNCTIYGAAPQTSPRGFTAPPVDPSCKRAYPTDERICH